MNDLYNNLGIPLDYTIEATVEYKLSNQKFTKLIKVPVEFDNFIVNQNDTCNF
ncbi:hypothetical protein [Thermovibrio sp.]